MASIPEKSRKIGRSFLLKSVKSLSNTLNFDFSFPLIFLRTRKGGIEAPGDAEYWLTPGCCANEYANSFSKFLRRQTYSDQDRPPLIPWYIQSRSVVCCIQHHVVYWIVDMVERLFRIFLSIVPSDMYHGPRISDINKV